MKLSVVIPAHNEEGCVGATVQALYAMLTSEAIPHEILVVNDNSTDGTAGVLAELERSVPTLRTVHNSPPHGFGYAVRAGLAVFTGDAVAVYMADNSDDPADLVRFWRALIEQGVDCVFGTRFSKGGRVIGYPWPKLVMNRLANAFIRPPFQPDRGAAAEGHRAWLLVRGCSQPLDQPQGGRLEAPDQGNGFALSIHRALLSHREVVLAWGLPPRQIEAGGNVTRGWAG
jgi:glycosyltransferase involved in cell wall biosynthesis